jgi:hypothetical protein
MDFREPFDTQKNPSLSSQLFKAAPGVFGGKNGINPLQTANRVIVGGPIDIFDLVGRVGEAGLMGLSEAVGEGYEALGGGQGMSERLKRDVYGLGQIGGMMAGSSPSALPSARVPSTRRAAPSDSTLSGVEKAFGNKKEIEDFKKKFEYDVYHGQRDPEYSIGVTKDPSGREMLVEDATGEYGGINAFESSADKFPSHYPTDLGTFVSESRDVANHFAGDRGAVYPLKMRMKNPMRYETYEDLEDALNEVGDTSELSERLIKEGYDGIEITYSDTDIPEIRRDFIPFDGRQLRSVNAKFDPEKRDMRNITYKQGGIVYNPFKAGIGAL